MVHSVLLHPTQGEAKLGIHHLAIIPAEIPATHVNLSLRIGIILRSWTLKLELSGFDME